MLRLGGTASAGDGTAAAGAVALALSLQHRLRHLLYEQRNAVGALNDVLADFRGKKLVADDAIDQWYAPLREAVQSTASRKSLGRHFVVYFFARCIGEAVDCVRQFAQAITCSQRKPSSVRCSAQSVSSRDVCLI